MIEVVVTTVAISRAKLQSNRHHQQTNIQFFTGRMPFLSPNQQCQSTEGQDPRPTPGSTPPAYDVLQSLAAGTQPDRHAFRQTGDNPPPPRRPHTM